MATEGVARMESKIAAYSTATLVPRMQLLEQ